MAAMPGDGRIQVIVDIDDTVKSSGGVTIAGIALGGIDTQYKRGTFYPGCFRFFLGLSKCGLDASDSQQAEPRRVAVLTARAAELKWALQLKETDKVCMAFSGAGKEEGYKDWGIGDVMYGSVREWMVQDLKGWRKYENFKLLRALYAEEPEAYVFVGDTGEMDKEAGMRMLSDKRSGGRVKAIFMHVVCFDESQKPFVPNDTFINGKPIVHFRTYCGAAHKAVDYGFMGVAEAKAVVLQACRDLREAEQSAGLGSDAHFPSKWMDMQRDISALMRAYPEVDLDLAQLAPRVV